MKDERAQELIEEFLAEVSEVAQDNPHLREMIEWHVKQLNNALRFHLLQARIYKGIALGAVVLTAIMLIEIAFRVYGMITDEQNEIFLWIWWGAFGVLFGILIARRYFVKPPTIKSYYDAKQDTDQ